MTQLLQEELGVLAVEAAAAAAATGTGEEGVVAALVEPPLPPDAGLTASFFTLDGFFFAVFFGAFFVAVFAISVSFHVSTPLSRVNC